MIWNRVSNFGFKCVNCQIIYSVIYYIYNYFIDIQYIYLISLQMLHGKMRGGENWYLVINHYNAESFLYKPWRPKGFIQFENIDKCLS